MISFGIYGVAHAWISHETNGTDAVMSGVLVCPSLPGSGRVVPLYILTAAPIMARGIGARATTGDGRDVNLLLRQAWGV